MKVSIVIVLMIMIGIGIGGCTVKHINGDVPRAEAGSSRAPAQPDVFMREDIDSYAEMPVVEETPEAVAMRSSPAVKTPRTIQQALSNAGLYKGKIDGKIGLKTTAAIQEFQRRNGLKVDGKVGPKTWEKLKKHL